MGYEFRPGDVVNSHVLGSDGRWTPLPAQTEPPRPTQALSAPQPDPHSFAPGARNPVGLAAGPADRTTSQAGWLPTYDPYATAAAPTRHKERHPGRWVAGVLGTVMVTVLVAAALSSGSGDTASRPSGDAGSAERAEGAGVVQPGAPGEASNVEEGAAGGAVDLASFAQVDASGWASIERNPDAAAGQQIIVFAEVTQFDAATGDESFRANAGATQPTSTFELATNTFFDGDAATLAPVAQGDIVRVFAEVQGAMEYETMIGGSTVVPALRVVAIEVVGFLDLTGDATLGSPEKDDWAGFHVPVTITNSGSAVMTYWVEVVVESRDGSVQFESAIATADTLKPGQSTTADAYFFDDAPGDAVVRVASVERFGS